MFVPSYQSLFSSFFLSFCPDRQTHTHSCTRHLTTPACVLGGRLSTRVSHWTPTTAFVGRRHESSAANQHTSWRSLIRCCWTWIMEQYASPAERVGHYTRTIRRALKMHLFGYWQLQRRVTVFFVRCV